MVQYAQMKFLPSIFVLFLLVRATVAQGAAVPQPSDYVDTEAETNMVFDAGDIYARRLDLTFELDAAASNSVIVAFGHDANTNGILERAEENKIARITKSEAYAMLLQQVYRPQNSEAMQKTLLLIDRMAEQTALYRLGCNMDISAAETAYQAMKG